MKPSIPSALQESRCPLLAILKRKKSSRFENLKCFNSQNIHCTCIHTYVHVHTCCNAYLLIQLIDLKFSYLIAKTINAEKTLMNASTSSLAWQCSDGNAYRMNNRSRSNNGIERSRCSNHKTYNPFLKKKYKE